MSRIHDDDGPLRWLFLDFDSYFAAVEQQENPRWRNRPLMVVPLEQAEATMAIAVSRQAKAKGVRRGMTLAQARALCPDIAVATARHEVYVRWHHRLLAEVERHLPIDLVHSIDELSARLGRGQRQPVAAQLLARQVKRGIANRFGPTITCSIGLAPSRLLAKIAAEMDKPDGLRVITPADLPDVLLPLALEDLPGISTGIARRLAAAGVRDVAGLWRLAPRQARAIWGTVVGERFIRALHGEDVDPPPPGPPRSFGHGRVLGPELADPQAAWPVACALLLKAAMRLRRAGMVAREVVLAVRWREDRGSRGTGIGAGVGVRTGGGADTGAGAGLHAGAAAPPAGRRLGWQPVEDAWRELLPVATADSFLLLRALERLWKALQRAASADARGMACRAGQVWGGGHARRRLRSVHVFLACLSPETARQLDLFADTDARWRERERLWAEIDRLNRRFGGRVVEPASLKHLDLKYLGAKIAFGRVPEAADFDGARP